MTTRRSLLAAAGSALLAAPWAGARATPATRLLDAADVHVAGYPTVEAVRWMGTHLRERTAGRLDIRMFHAGQLGREADTLTLIRHGALAMTRVTTASLNNAVPATRLLSLPYVFDDVAHMRRALDGPVGARVLESFAPRGWVGLALYDGGVRCIYNVRRPVVTPADLAGLKLRVPPSDLFMAVLRGYGANATPLPYGEVYSAMQTHLIDGAENNWPSFHSSRQFEVARYWSETRHAMTPDVLVMSAKVYAALSADEQHHVRELAQHSVAVMREAWDARVEQARTAALAGGVLVNEVDHAAFRAVAQPLVQAQLAQAGLEDLYREVRALSAQEAA